MNSDPRGVRIIRGLMETHERGEAGLQKQINDLKKRVQELEDL